MKCYDPRDPEQKSDDSTTWKETQNPALIVAQMAHDCGVARVPDFWDIVREQADMCDHLVRVQQ